MDGQKNMKKLVILGMTLLIIAGIVLVLLKGFNVSLEFGNHEELEIKLDVDVDITKVEETAKETFGDKNFIVKELEVFGDSAQIIVESVTDDEKETLVNKLNEKFGTEKTVDDLNVYTTPKKRIRDSIKPFIIPMIIAYIIVFVYMLIRFRKMNPLKMVLTTIGQQILLEALLVSVIAVTRCVVDELVISSLVLIAILHLTYKNDIVSK